MIKLFAALAVFLAAGAAAILTAHDKTQAVHSVAKWLLGFFTLVVVVLFAQSVVFEYLGWNGTDKNDWFFILWWVLVLAWFFHGLRQLFASRG